MSQGRVDAALVPVFAYQEIDDIRLIPEVCVGAKERVRSVCLVTKGEDLKDVRSVSLDISSRTSVALTKIIFREFLGFEPEWRYAEPNIEQMLAQSDAALLIGDPALLIAECGVRSAESDSVDSAFRIRHSAFRKSDLAELWRSFTGLGFVFAMWMTRAAKSPIDFAAARDEGLAHVEEIISNYQPEIALERDEMRRYLTENISYTADVSMQAGLELYYRLAEKHGLIERNKPLEFAT